MKIQALIPVLLVTTTLFAQGEKSEAIKVYNEIKAKIAKNTKFVLDLTKKSVLEKLELSFLEKDPEVLYSGLKSSLCAGRTDYVTGLLETLKDDPRIKNLEPAVKLCEEIGKLNTDIPKITEAIATKKKEIEDTKKEYKDTDELSKSVIVCPACEGKNRKNVYGYDCGRCNGAGKVKRGDKELFDKLLKLTKKTKDLEKELDGVEKSLSDTKLVLKSKIEQVLWIITANEAKLEPEDIETGLKFLQRYTDNKVEDYLTDITKKVLVKLK